jgi:23S rRNA (guanosine2251-2'-O)-methyltransferase
MKLQTLFGFHAITVRLKTTPASIQEIHFDTTRRDPRMRQLLDRAQTAGVTALMESDARRLDVLTGNARHQGVVARVEPIRLTQSLDDLLDSLDQGGDEEGAEENVPLLLVLDGVTDPHNLGACLRVADGAGVQAVIAPRDHAVGINPVVSKVACGAAEVVPYFMVTNLARTLGELRDRMIRVVGTSDVAEESIYATDLRGPLAMVLGAEGKGLRQLTVRTCDVLVKLPMRGMVESLNVSVATGICLYEAVRQREHLLD